MMYKHGIYGEQAPTQDMLPPSGVATLPVYIGTAPVQQRINSEGAINKAILVYTLEQAQAAVGYSDDWGTFTLCEAIYAHFSNKIQTISPIVLINVMDPEVHISEGTENVLIKNGIGYIQAPAVLDSIQIIDKVKGTDYDVAYLTNGKLQLKEKVSGSLGASVLVSFDKMDISIVEEDDIIGQLDNEGNRSGIYCIDLIYQAYNMIPTILAAPGWSHIPSIKEKMIEKSMKVNGHWDLQVNVDIDSSSLGAQSINDAITLKETSMYMEKNLKACWPKGKRGDRFFWLSTIATVRMQQTDYNNDNVPYESPSNKPIDISGTVLADGSSIKFDEVQANELSKNGITTVCFNAGRWVLWGPHNANYDYTAEIDPRDVFDAGVRMMMYLTNTFQQRYMSDVDSPLNRSKVQTIINDSQIWLDSLVADGKLLFGNIVFAETSNSMSSIVEGEFTFDVSTTTTPVGKALNFKVRYTTAGISTLFGGEGA